MKTKFLKNSILESKNIKHFSKFNSQILNNNNIKQNFSEKIPQDQKETSNQSNQNYLANLLKKPFSFSTSKSYLNFIESNNEKRILKNSLIRELDIGKNYFSHINPRRKKLLTTLLNSYVKALNKVSKENEVNEFVIALDLYYKNSIGGKKFEDLEDKELNFSEGTLMHLNNLFSFDRYATSYCRYEYMDYQIMIEDFNSIEENKANKAKYIFTLHPNIPNSTEQTLIFYEINKAIEENDLEYLDVSMMNFIEACRKRKFEKPNIFDEYYANISKCLPNMMKAIGMAYESGFEKLSSFYETPGFYIEYSLDENESEGGNSNKVNNNINSNDNDKDNDNINKQNFPEKKITKKIHDKNPQFYDFDLGYLSYAHLTNIRICINNYKEIIQEAKISQNFHIIKILENLAKLENYCNKIQEILGKLNSKNLSEANFLTEFPVLDINKIEENIQNLLENLSKDISLDNKSTATGKKILEIFKIFKMKGTSFQLIFPYFAFENTTLEENKYFNILSEAKLINNNGNFVDMIVLSNYSNLSEYKLAEDFLNKFQIKGNIELIPRINSFSSYNDTTSKITFIASSHMRKNDGLLLTELRLLRESKNNPEKTILLGQGTSSERGGGPYKLIHMKYKSLTKTMRERHLRTVQGFYFTAEFISKDLAFTFLLNGSLRINSGEHFNPSNAYMDFLFELDSVIGVPQRSLRKSKEWNDLLVKNPKIKTLIDLYDYSGAKENLKPLEDVNEEKAVVQAYLYSDRCTNLHWELAYWDRVTDNLQKKIIYYYYNNNRHFKYVLYVYAFMLKRFDVEFAIQELGVDSQDKYVKDILKGKKALEGILDKLGLGVNSSPVISMYSQHLGLIDGSKLEEVDNKERSYKMMYMLQNYQVNKYLKEKKIGLDEDAEKSERKIKIIQSGLSNVSQFNGKG